MIVNKELQRRLGMIDQLFVVQVAAQQEVPEETSQEDSRAE